MKIPFSHTWKALFVFIFFALQSNIYAQKGYPYISPFSFDEAINNDNFDLVQDNNQNILIANRKGILTFDSRNWDLLPLTFFPVVLTKSIVDGTIYVGCRNGFGYLKQDDNGKYNYELLSDTLFTGEISAIKLTANREFFTARNRIYYSDVDRKKLKYWEFPYEYDVSGCFIFFQMDLSTNSGVNWRKNSLPGNLKACC
jgi:hypothetical protein